MRKPGSWLFTLLQMYLHRQAARESNDKQGRLSCWWRYLSGLHSWTRPSLPNAAEMSVPTVKRGREGRNSNPEPPRLPWPPPSNRDFTSGTIRELQTQGNFDTKTSSWLKTILEIRMPGGACLPIVAADMLRASQQGDLVPLRPRVLCLAQGLIIQPFSLEDLPNTFFDP